ncbi:thioesterase family protein [Actinosynnema sp. NPDC047251]|uniref:Thioesterase superfamily protein n=1 Tax=Saccharothrix espanaensis (strain ATCC 51144 / DSM 44229 / JCM 9112 / NBRC 15066 / NRRL 15764) TaxID=1179773 RepID=K0JZA3_SACES|nr:thioesterase family protein [Saccharothrix espanaensis]CCH33330.1 Thioesterase superfamily protein [Saccharothrix espanaensis DSM 44229]
MRDYRHWQRIPTRWADNDVYGHVNNVVHYAFMDTVINTWLISEAGLDIHGGAAIGLCVESHCNYRAPISFPDAVDGGLRVGRLGRSSVRYEVGFFPVDRDDVVAEGHFVHVFVDRLTREPVEIPAGLRAAMEGLVVR